MRKAIPTLLFAGAAALAVNGSLVVAQDASEREILSSEDGALLPPEYWDCSIYVEEYEDYLEAGNVPESWRFVGKRYRSAGDGEIYDWREWLDWYEDADCAAAGYIDGQTAAAGNTAGGATGGTTGGAAAGGGLFGGGSTGVAIVAGLVVTGLIAAGSGGGSDGGNNMSPG